MVISLLFENMIACCAQKTQRKEIIVSRILKQ